MSDGTFTPRTRSGNLVTCHLPLVTFLFSVRAPRIVLIDDEPMLREMMELVLRPLFDAVTFLSFPNQDMAWQELLRAAPDLLITDMNNVGMGGWGLLPRLAKRAVKYPILVISGSFSMSKVESLARETAGRGLNISFMAKPFSMDFFRREVSRLLGGGEPCGRRFPKDK